MTTIFDIMRMTKGGGESAKLKEAKTMIKTEKITDNIVRTYSDAGVYIHGGDPEADYITAEDPISAGRTYTETDRPITAQALKNEDEATAEDYQSALAALGIE